jgi:Protein of unknown function (DUF2971)
MKLYYLCPQQFGVSNLALRRLKIARFVDLNDPFELLAIDLAEKGHRKVFRALKDELNKNKGLICFARSWNNPLMWGHYAESHTGMALGFDVHDSFVKPVVYARKLHKIGFDQATRKPNLTFEVMERLLRTKFYDWKYEDELRAFVELDHASVESGLYFFDFGEHLTLREVVLGARCSLPIERIRSIVLGYDTPVDVLRARIAFSSFRVVKDQSQSATDARTTGSIEQIDRDQPVA